MAIAHTPGPWAVDSNGPGHEVVLARGGRHAVAAVQGPDDHHENLANARLIAAAPDLLAACKTLIDAPHHDHFASRLGDEEMDGIDAIKAAIAKAEGR